MRNYLVRIIKEEISQILSEEGFPPSAMPTDAAAAAVMALQAFTIANMTKGDYAAMGWNTELVGSSPLQGSGKFSAENFIDGKFGPITRKALSLIADNPAQDSVSISMKGGTIKIDDVLIRPAAPSAAAAPPPQPPPQPPPAKKKKVVVKKPAAKQTVPKPSPPLKKPKPAGLLSSLPRGKNLIGETFRAQAGGKSFKLGFSPEGLSIDDRSFGFFTTILIGLSRLTVKRVQVNGSGQSAVIEMSYAGQAESKRFTEQELVGIINRLSNKGTATVRAGQRKIIIK